VFIKNFPAGQGARLVRPAVESVHPVDQILPIPRLLVLGLQHVLVMYAGAVAVPLIVGHALKLSPSQVAYLISADLFACGLATLVQVIGFPGVGIRLPIMMGVTFASVAPMMAMIAAGAAVGRDSQLTLDHIYGATILCGAVGFVAAPFVGRLARLFPPVVTGSVILVIGMSLLNIGVNWAAGGQPSDPDYGSPINLATTAFVLLVILAINRFTRGFVSHVAVLVGICAGAAASALLHRMSFAQVMTAPWFGVVAPLHFGLPRLEPVSAATMCLVMLVIMIESLGMFLAVGRSVDSMVTRQDIVRGFRADALGAVIGGVFNTFPYTSYSQNVGLIGLTNVRSRFVCAGGAAIMLVLGLSPKLAALVEAVPLAVLGGAGLVMFGMIAATGVRILAAADLTKSRNNLLVVAVSVSVGLIPVVAPQFFKAMPAALGPLLGSGIVLATIASVALNLFFNGLGPAGEPEEPI
jgi:NCS2 family nucleobase:cation symporter-2